MRRHGFKPGFDARRNLKGRPPRAPFTDELRAQLEALSDDDEVELKAVIRAVITSAKHGNVQAQTLIAHYLDGKPKQNIELTTAPGGLELHNFQHMTAWRKPSGAGSLMERIPGQGKPGRQASEAYDCKPELITSLRDNLNLPVPSRLSYRSLRWLGVGILAFAVGAGIMLPRAWLSPDTLMVQSWPNKGRRAPLSSSKEGRDDMFVPRLSRTPERSASSVGLSAVKFR